MAMEEYLNKGIKQIITKFPNVADILNEYNIGCVPCNVGTCLLKDIVEIHNLAEDEEQELIAKIAKAIYPDKEIRIPKIKRKTKSKEIKYSPPIKKLVDEHSLIKRWIALIPKAIETFDIKSALERQLILDGVDFIKSYADRFHHAKEEDILFKYTDDGLEIIQTIYKDHENARSHAKKIIEALERNDKPAVVKYLQGYKELLTEHIKKEDEILYPWIERNLSITQVGELFTKFNEADKKIGEVVAERGEEFIENIEERLQPQMAQKDR